MKTLLVGNTSYLDKEFLQAAFPEDKVFILGDTALSSTKRPAVTIFSRKLTRQRLEEVLKLYRFESIIYLSQSLTLGNQEIGELDYLQLLFSSLQGVEETQFIYVAGPVATTTEQIFLSSASNLCQTWQRGQGSSLRILKSPYLYSPYWEGDFLYRTFRALSQSGEIVIAKSVQDEATFISPLDLADLLYKLAHQPCEYFEDLLIPYPFQRTFGEFKDKLKDLDPSFQPTSLKFLRSTLSSFSYSKDGGNQLRQEYGWFMKIDLLEELVELYETYTESRERAGNVQNKFALPGLKKQSLWQSFLEVFIFFAVAEALHLLANRLPQFQQVDIRLLFVILVSTVYGMGLGLLAAVLAILALLWGEVSLGVDWHILFFNTEQWIPFVVYILAAMAFGFVQSYYLDSQRSLSKEVSILRERQDFLQQAYVDALQDNQVLKKQILASRQGAVKFFSLSKQLSALSMGKVLIETQELIKRDLEVEKLGLYRLQEGNKFILVNPQDDLPPSIDLLRHQEILSQLQEKQVWVNKTRAFFAADYLVALYLEGQLQYLVWLEEIPYDKLTSYYETLLEMLAHISQERLLTAYYREIYQYLLEQNRLPSDRIKGGESV